MLNFVSMSSFTAHIIVTFRVRVRVNVRLGVCTNLVNSEIAIIYRTFWQTTPAKIYSTVGAGAIAQAGARAQGRTGPPGCLALARWAGWSAGQVGRHVKC